MDKLRREASATPAEFGHGLGSVCNAEVREMTGEFGNPELVEEVVYIQIIGGGMGACNATNQIGPWLDAAKKRGVDLKLGDFCQITYRLACLFVRLLCCDNSPIA